tara:strand:+ start:397 stop:615 length:219 start_codon:yes stop_codon:yes gene_type:complete
MTFLITFLTGLAIGWLLRRRYQSNIELKKERLRFSDEIDLRATPDEYLSEVKLLEKKYLEAKFKKMIETIGS